MIRKILCILILAGILFTCAMYVFAADSAASEAADRLHALGLFNGTGTDENGNPLFELDRTPTRHEAMVMLVRLLGKEEEALNGTWEMPFIDVADWAKPYIGYAYANGLTSGTGADTFGGDAPVSAAQYLTFVLRALGYKSGVDFQWDKAWELTDQLGLTDGEYHAENDTFVRGDIAIVSADALEQPMKEEKITLAEHIQAESPKTEPQKPKPQTPSVSADVISEPAPDMEAHLYADGTYCGLPGVYIADKNSFRVEAYCREEKAQIYSCSVGNPSVCTAQVNRDGTMTVTRTGDGVTDIKVFYRYEKQREEQENGPVDLPPITGQMRSDMTVRYGEIQHEKGLSLLWRGNVIKNGSGFGLIKCNHTIFVPAVLFDGEAITDYTVTSADADTKFTVQADGTLLIEKPNTGSGVSFTITYGKHTATFSVSN